MIVRPALKESLWAKEDQEGKLTPTPLVAAQISDLMKFDRGISKLSPNMVDFPRALVPPMPFQHGSILTNAQRLSGSCA
jgi:hypothetical protein